MSSSYQEFGVQELEKCYNSDDGPLDMILHLVSIKHKLPVGLEVLVCSFIPHTEQFGLIVHIIYSICYSPHGRI